VAIRGGASKQGYGRPLEGSALPLDTREWSGVVAHAPEELVVTARAGTPLAELEAQLARAGQMLPFEPPHFNAGTTLGGCVAAGLSGPRRAYAGAVRDSVLGIRMMDGRGRRLRFGGQVIKNVAGFDVARLLAGSLGTLGLLTEVSLKLLPRPEQERSFSVALAEAEALATMARWRRLLVPVSASAYLDGRLHVRLSGRHGQLSPALALPGCDADEEPLEFWTLLRDHRHRFFAPAPDRVLLRLSVRADAPPLPGPFETAVEWGGALRWAWAGETDIAALRTWAAGQGGHGTLFTAPDALRRAAGAFAPLPAAHLALLRRIKQVFDPHAIFNPGRLYAAL
jgi:glycolate oxidase FAD binding subunit